VRSRNLDDLVDEVEPFPAMCDQQHRTLTGGGEDGFVEERPVAATRKTSVPK
jgi:hypothetical protein